MSNLYVERKIDNVKKEINQIIQELQDSIDSRDRMIADRDKEIDFLYNTIADLNAKGIDSEKPIKTTESLEKRVTRLEFNNSQNTKQIDVLVEFMQSQAAKNSSIADQIKQLWDCVKIRLPS